MIKVYLSGPMSGLIVQEATKRRFFYEQNLGPEFETISPMRDWHLISGREFEDYADDIIAPQVDKPESTTNFACDKEIFMRDKFDVIHSDCVIVDVLDSKKVSIGTAFEIAWANEFTVPIILVMEEKDNPHDHAFIKECSSFRVHTRERAVDVIRSVFNLKPVCWV